MTPSPTVAAVTGASGYLGSRICAALESRGWQVVRLVRRPDPRSTLERKFDLGAPVDAAVLSSVDLVVHAAYDLALTRRSDIWRVNVLGTRALLEAARQAGVSRIVVLSSMSAFDGTTQIYGSAKLAIEAIASEFNACSIRPGIVYGDRPGGMAGALRKVTKLPLVPLPAGGARQYPLHEDDLMAVIGALSAVDELPTVPIGVVPDTAVPFRDLLCFFAEQEDRPCRFLPVPWRLVYWVLRAAELARIPLPFRADSLLGLARPAPFAPGREQLRQLGVNIRNLPRGRRHGI